MSTRGSQPAFRPRLGARPLALLLAALAIRAGAQTPPPSPPPPPASPASVFSGSADVKLIEIPVQVTRNGEPVRGLVADDFQVWSGKQQQRIIAFDAVDVAQVEARSPQLPAPAVPTAARRHFLFLFDLSQSNPTSLVRAQRAALSILDDLGPSDLAAVATYSPGRGPRVLLAFTPDRKQVVLALQTLGSTELIESRPDWLGLSIGAAKQELAAVEMRPVRASRLGEFDGVQVQRAQDYLENMRDTEPLETRATTGAARDRASTFAHGMADLGNLLGSVAGRKQVLLLSQGFDADLLTGKGGREPNQEEVPSDSAKEVYRSDFDVKFGSSQLQHDMQGLVVAMQHADCAIHSVDIAGLEGGGRALDDTTSAVKRTGAGEDSLFFLAKETGGTFHRGSNDLRGALADVLRATSVTYVLTIAPEHVSPAKDGYVPLRVTVSGGGTVSARAGYSTAAPPMGAVAAMQERLGIGAQVLEGRAGGAIASSVLGFADADNGNAYAVVAVDGSSLLASSGDSMVSGEVTVYAFARDGGIAGVARQLVTFDVGKVGDRLRATGFELFAPFAVPAGSYQLRALVRNTLSGAYGIAVGTLDVPATNAAPPLAAVFAQPPGQNWLLLRNGGAATAYPFAIGGKLVTPALRPRLHAGDTPTIWLRAGDNAVLQATVRRSDGTPGIPATLEILSREPTTSGETLLARLGTPALSVGSYTLELRSAQGGAVALPFSVE